MAGANPVYLGAELPVEDLVDAVERAEAAALALSLVTIPLGQGESAVRAVRSGLPEHVHLWLGGAKASSLEPRDGVELIDRLENFEQRVALLAFERVKGG